MKVILPIISTFIGILIPFWVVFSAMKSFMKLRQRYKYLERESEKLDYELAKIETQHDKI